MKVLTEQESYEINRAWDFSLEKRELDEKRERLEARLGEKTSCTAIGLPAEQSRMKREPMSSPRRPTFLGF